MEKVAVISIGGNAISKAGQKGTIPEQFENTRESAEHIVDIIREGYSVVVTHGNGPQVGNVLLRAEMAEKKIYPLGLDTCGADTQGGMGYMIQQTVDNVLKRRGLEKTVATIVTQVVVDKDDPAFRNPTKPIGRYYTKEDADRLRSEKGWDIKEDSGGRGWRRVVPSPTPLEIVEVEAIRTLLESGCIVIACGGGGIPVIRSPDGSLKGVEAVIDKDLASSLLARRLCAGIFVIATDVEKVCINFKKPGQVELDRMTVSEAKHYSQEGHFAPGSMKPKVKAALDFVEATGNKVIITSIDGLGPALRGETGTHITA